MNIKWSTVIVDLCPNLSTNLHNINKVKNWVEQHWRSGACNKELKKRRRDALDNFYQSICEGVPLVQEKANEKGIFTTDEVMEREERRRRWKAREKKKDWKKVKMKELEIKR